MNDVHVNMAGVSCASAQIWSSSQAQTIDMQGNSLGKQHAPLTIIQAAR